jgi:glycosyltransferase involved in cell wall biosynthesis
MASGRPVVSTTVGSMSDAVADGETGKLVSPSDIDAMTKAVAQILGDETLRISMGEKARHTILAHWSSMASSLDLCALVESIAEP